MFRKYLKHNKRVLSIRFLLKNIYNDIYFNTSDDDYIFLHIPKTAGTYFAQLETKKIKNIRYIGHTNIEGVRKVPYLEGYPKTRIKRKKINGLIISIARDPVSWITSYYGHAVGVNLEYENKNHIDYGFKDNIDALVNDIVCRSDRWPNKYGNILKYCDSDGNFLPDILLFQESLDEGLKILEKMSVCEREKRTVQRKSNETILLSEDSVKLIKKAWSLDYEVFKYVDGKSGYGAIKIFDKDEKVWISQLIKKKLNFQS